MPIVKDEFDEIDEEIDGLDSAADAILDFLIQNQENAYTQSELADETDVPEERIGPALERLKGRASVEQKSEYWRVSDHRLAVRAGTKLTAETARKYDDGEEFDIEKWAEYAVDEVDLNRGENE